MCQRLTLPTGEHVLVCGGRGRGRKCAYPTCKARATIECDHREADGTTCDRATCRAHAKPLEPHVDWCWRCVQVEARGSRVTVDARQER